MTGLLLGLLTGFFLAIPPGPINFAIFEKSIHGQHRSAWRLMLGCVTGDAFYCLMAVIYQLSTGLMRIINIAFSGFGSLFLIGLAIYYTWFKRCPASASASGPPAEPDACHHGHFLSGVAISLANPFLILILIALTDLYYSLGWLVTNLGVNLAFIIGFQSGTLLWLWGMGRLTSRNRHLFSSFPQKIQRVCGMAFFGFGIYLLLKCISLIWEA